MLEVCSRHSPLYPNRWSKRSTVPRDRKALLKKKRVTLRKISSVKLPDQLEKLHSLYNKLGAIELGLGESFRKQHKKEEDTALDKIKENPKAFYSYANRTKNVRTNVGPLRDKSGTLQSDPGIMASLLQDQYCRAFSSPNPQPDTDLPQQVMKSITEIEITPQLVTDAIKDLSTGAAPGPDKFPALLLKNCCGELSPKLAELWTTSFESGEIASIFKRQTVVPIYKGGNKGEPANYRPVSLTSHLIKVMERIVRRQLMDYVEEANLIPSVQHGFRSGRSCLTQLVQHVEDIMSDLEQGANADVIYIDLSKAFDKVDHRRLLEKLKKYGVGGKLLKWLSAFLLDRTQTVVIDGTSSPPRKVASGVPQGTVLAPLLFLLYLADLPSYISQSYLKLFADDSKLHKTIKTTADRQLLLEDLQRVYEWANTNSMELNSGKFQLIQHGKLEDLKLPYTLPSGEVLTADQLVKDLGIFIDPNFTWKDHITTIIKRANSMAAWVLRTFASRKPEHMLLLYKTYIRPHLEYCSPLWSPTTDKLGEIRRLEAVQRSFTAKIAGLGELNYWERLDKLGLYSIQRRHERYKILTIWKMYVNATPRPKGIVFAESSRYGPTAVRQRGTSKSSGINTLIHNKFTSTGISLFSKLPANVKYHFTIDKVKAALDLYLKHIPDLPPLANYKAPNNNRIIDWLEQGADMKSYLPAGNN